MKKKKKITPDDVWKEYERGVAFNNKIKLDETVESNENFFVGKQWEGVQSNGLPTPVFNFLKRVTLFQVASITSDNIKMQASPLGITTNRNEVQTMADIVNKEFDSLFEQNQIPIMLREFLRNAAVDGDACMYTYWEPDVETGQSNKGAICTEIIENTRVFFGNPNDRRVQKQPYIIIESREMCDSVKQRAEDYGNSSKDIVPDESARQENDALRTDDKVTVLLKLWKEDGTVWGYECTQKSVVRKKWDLGLTLYPITWLSWDYIQNSYHGQALITGLLPNQKFVNKAWAMSMISMMSSAYPKTVYDKTRIKNWDNRVGGAIGVNGGDVSSVAKIIEPAQISPQIAQFIQLAVDQTQTFLGATSAAMGDTRPDNTSAIIALQRASSVPSEITKQNLYKCVEDLGRIYIDFMREYYGKRLVERDIPRDANVQMLSFIGMQPGDSMIVEFDFDRLKNAHFTMKLDVGASSYWSEMASMSTLDNLLQQNKISLVDYLERVPDGYIMKRQELLEKLKAGQLAPDPTGGATGMPTEEAPELPTGGGYSALQRKINETGEVPA